MNAMSMEEYRKAYMDGYVAGLERARNEAVKEEKPFFTVDDVASRYNCGKNKAGEIIRAVRHVTGGGGFGSCGMVKRSELLYWESIVEKTFVERLSTGEAK